MTRGYRGETAGRKGRRKEAGHGGGTEAGNERGTEGWRKLSNEISAGRTVASRRVRPTYGMISVWRCPENIIDIDKLVNDLS